MNRQPNLRELLNAAKRGRNHSLRTEDACVHGIKRFIGFTDRRRPLEMGAEEATGFRARGMR